MTNFIFDGKNVSMKIGPDSAPKNQGVFIPPVKKIVYDIPNYKNNPLLFQKTKPCDLNDAFKMRELTETLIDTVQYHKGLGLAANQVGFDLSAFVINYNNEIYLFYNPELRILTDRKIKLEEGCLSYPNIFANVERFDDIELKWLTFQGETAKMQFNGYISRIIQHEFSHLQGKSFLYGKSRLELEMILKKCRKNYSCTATVGDLIPSTF